MNELLDIIFDGGIAILFLFLVGYLIIAMYQLITFKFSWEEDKPVKLVHKKRKK